MKSKKQITVDKDFLKLLIHEKTDVICEGDCENCIFASSRKKNNISSDFICSDIEFDTLLKIHLETFKEFQGYGERENE